MISSLVEGTMLATVKLARDHQTSASHCELVTLGDKPLLCTRRVVHEKGELVKEFDESEADRGQHGAGRRGHRGRKNRGYPAFPADRKHVPGLS